MLNLNENLILINDDCFNVFSEIPSNSIDCIICDLPYGTTKAKWDIPLPLNDYIEVTIKNKMKHLSKEEFLLINIAKVPYNKLIEIWNHNHKKGLWHHYNRIIKDNGAIILFAQSPFDKILGFSNLKNLRYEWIWEKTCATGHLNANKMPMKAHENILVFYKKLPVYNPQKTTGHKPTNSYFKRLEVQNNTELYGYMNREIKGGGNTDRFPRSVIKFSTDKQKEYSHSTQKPLSIINYLVRTYTNEGDIILDNTMGSGTTGISSLLYNRKFIGIEKEKDIFKKAIFRISNFKEYSKKWTPIT